MSIQHDRNGRLFRRLLDRVTVGGQFREATLVRVFKGRRVVLPGGESSASIHVDDGHIVAVAAYDEHPSDADVVDAGDAVILPGLVDTHVHFNDPGRTQWEGFVTGTRAAAAGGVTTIVEMPLNSIPATTTVDALDAKLEAAKGNLWVDVGFWGGVVPGNAAQLEPLHDAGVLGFKCFLVPSGVDDFGHVGEAELREALPILARLGAPLLVHAELPGPIVAAIPAAGDPQSYRRYLASRPPAAENEAVELMLRLCTETGAHVHIVHLASADALPALRAGRRAGLPVTVETCPHYLYFSAEDVPDGDTSYKCAPPIREAAHRDELWAALEAGDIDLIATDHSPCPPELKLPESGDFMRAWGGIASIQLGLSAVWTLARRRGVPLSRVVDWMAAASAKLAGLSGRKGVIAPGAQADLVFFDPNATLRVDPDLLYHRHAVTPYAGAELAGRVRETWLRGRKVFGAEGPSDEPHGHWLARASVRH